MSLASWKQEFMPVPAIERAGTWAAALKHSLRKWKGLTAVSLEKHGIVCNGRGYVLREKATGRDMLEVATSESCALCRRADKVAVASGLAGAKDCSGCPLDAVLGMPCVSDCGPYSTYERSGDAQPMIDALLLATAWQAKSQRQRVGKG